MSNLRSHLVTQRLKSAAIAWALGHAVLSAALLYAIYAPMPDLLKPAAYLLIAWTPVGAAMTYTEAREVYIPGVDLAGPVISLAVIVGLGLLAWFLG